MGLYIKGMKMPKNCDECLFKHLSTTGENIVCDLDISTVSWEIRPFDCPLAPVPDHGDLIDQDALKAKGTDIRDTWVDYDGREDTVRGFSLDMIDNTPTIIPTDTVLENEIHIIDTKGKSNYDPKRRFVISSPTIITEEKE